MKLTKIVCPNCNGTLDIPEGMKEGFVTCKFCNTKIYLEPHKPDITQNIHIDKVNYNTPYTAPPKKGISKISIRDSSCGTIFTKHYYIP